MRVCLVCKAPIDVDRLEAIPQTRLCAEHGQKINAYGGEFSFSTTKEGTGSKTGEGVVSRSSTRNTQAIERLRDDYEREQFDSQ